MYSRGTTLSQIFQARTNHFNDLRPTPRSQVSKISQRRRITSFAKFLTVHIIHGSIPSETSPMWKPTTGEPCAGKPPARFGGRGGESLPYPYHKAPSGAAISARKSRG